MFCGNCGNKIENGETFCGNCGYKVNNEEDNGNVTVNNSSSSKRTIYGVLSLFIGIGSIIATISIYLIDLKMALNPVTYIILFLLEGSGIFLGIKSKKAGRISGIILNVIAVVITLIMLAIILVLYGFSKLKMNGE